MKYFFANLKAHNTLAEAKEWAKTFTSTISQNSSVVQALQDQKLLLTICPPFPYIHTLTSLISLPSTYWGSQTISSFDQGNFTGEVTASMLADTIQYAIIGHSERRKYAHETEEDITVKITQAKKNNIKSIVCVRGTDDTIYPDADMIAYEPIGAIGSGKNISLEQILEMKKQLSLSQNQPFIYGGSVNAGNIEEYIRNPEIEGFLVGTASFDPLQLSALLTAAARLV